jgi:hypothetical protein
MKYLKRTLGKAATKTQQMLKNTGLTVVIESLELLIIGITRLTMTSSKSPAIF